MGSALLNTETPDSTFDPPAESAAAGQNPAALPASAATLRLQAAQRLAAHRNRRASPYAEPSQTRAAPGPSRPANPRSARIAAAVAERYAHTQSYRAFLAAEAERAVQQARAAAEIAALNAQAVAAAQQALLDTFDQIAFDQRAHPDEFAAIPNPESAAPGPVELALWPDLGAVPVTRSHHHSRPHHSATAPHASKPDPRTSNLVPAAPLTVRLYEDAASGAHVDLGSARRAATVPRADLRPDRNSDRNDPESLALDEEIAFRHAPVFEEPAGPPMPLPANLIEFPRQLVAPRKARPRLAEGPLRDETGATPSDCQLRIFEVDPAQISTTPADAALDAESADPAPQWTSIWLDTAADSTPTQAPGPLTAATVAQRTVSLPHAATIGRRTLAATIDGAVALAGLLAFTAIFVIVAGHFLPWQPAAGQPARILARAYAQTRVQTGIQLTQLPAAVAVTGGLLLLLYHTLFFCFSTATPGMRCTRIALCTFDDENPTRKAIRRRILAVLLSACPLGLGFLWAALDEDRLAWHDRLSRMYQRSY
jgi:uncharacterized RDD family membrane protein YckC